MPSNQGALEFFEHGKSGATRPFVSVTCRVKDAANAARLHEVRCYAASPGGYVTLDETAHGVA